MITKEEALMAMNSTENLKAAAAKLGVTDKVFYDLRIKHGITSRRKEDNDLEKKVEKERSQSRLNEVARENRRLIKELALKEEQIQGIWQIKGSVDAMGKGSPDWLKYTKSQHHDKSIPTLFYSDPHFGEVVKASQVNYVNEYSTEIAVKRTNSLINHFLKMTHEHLNSVDTDRMVLAFGGDNVSGNIHEELKLTNDRTVTESVWDFVTAMEVAIKELLGSGFKQIFIPCVSGNHDRNTNKTHNKNRLETSNSFLTYRFLQRVFENDSRVQFSVASGSDCLYQVNNHRMLLTHGDQFKGGSGIGGLSAPIIRAFLKKQSIYAQTGNDFDSLILGHFHHYMDLNNGQIIVNGTAKGFDEFSQAMGFGYQEPCQAMWMTDPKRGIVMPMPVYCEEKKEKEFRAEDWVSWKK